MLISTITSNISFIQLSLMHRITEKICKERWKHWCTKISGVKVLPTLLISTITSNMSFIQLSLMLSGYPASSFPISQDFVYNLIVRILPNLIFRVTRWLCNEVVALLKILRRKATQRFVTSPIEGHQACADCRFLV